MSRAIDNLRSVVAGALATVVGCAAPRTPAPAGAPPPVAAPAPIEVAITVDDLPRHGAQRPGHEPAAVAAALLDAFARHHVPSVYGFINAERLERHPEDIEVLRRWVAAGHPLGNHTFAHVDVEKLALADYLADIDRNEPLLAALAPPPWKIFRYPFLREGADAATRQAVRAHLASHGYRIAEVTIDPWDWAYNDPYVRCWDAMSDAARAAMRANLVAEARAKLLSAADAATAIAHRPVRQILLMHLGAIDADAIEALLTSYEAAGVRWIPLADALADPIYAEDPKGTRGGDFWGQLFRARGLRPPPPREHVPPRPTVSCPSPTPPD